MSSKRPSRLTDFTYIGIHAYFLTVCVLSRRPAFQQSDRATDVINELLRTAADYGFAVVAYCVMPDHAHALLEGTKQDSDFRKFVSMFRQRSGFHFKQTAGESLWQDGFYEHVLRSDEAYLPIAAYVLANPIRAGLCETIDAYPFSGSDRYTMQQLTESIQALTSRP